MAEDTKALEPMAHQVGGHATAKTQLMAADGKIFKPFQNKQRGEREHAFYELVNSEVASPELIQLRSLIPAYFGLRVDPVASESDADKKYLILEDLTQGRSGPCIMDVKAGTVSYEADATPEKIAYEKQKFPLQETVGLRIQGIKVLDLATQQYEELDKHFGRQAGSLEDLATAFGRYFPLAADPVKAIMLLKAFIQRLQEFESFFETQQEVVFIASSLLFLYNGQTDGASPAMAADVRLIDFAHVSHAPKDAPSRDEGVLTGIRTVLHCFRRLLAQLQSEANLMAEGGGFAVAPVRVVLPTAILDRSPSLEDGVPISVERMHRFFGCELIQEAGILLRLPQVVMVTAQTMLQRFYYRKSLRLFDAFRVAISCLFLAAKVEERPKRIKDVVTVFYAIYRRRKWKTTRLPQVLDTEGALFCQWREWLILIERQILIDMGFSIYNVTEHPHKYILYYIKIVDGDKELAQRAWGYLNDSLRIDLCVRYPAEVIACAAIFLAARVLQAKLPDNPPWYSLFDVALEPLYEASRAIMELYACERVEWLDALTESDPFAVDDDPQATAAETEVDQPTEQKQQDEEEEEQSVVSAAAAETSIECSTSETQPSSQPEEAKSDQREDQRPEEQQLKVAEEHEDELQRCRSRSTDRRKRQESRSTRRKRSSSPDDRRRDRHSYKRHRSRSRSFERRRESSRRRSRSSRRR